MTSLIILLVEDEPDVRSFLARALARLVPDAQIRTATDGVEALKDIAHNPPDLIVSDHRMPHMTGLELLDHVRAQANTPFVMLSADMTVQQIAYEKGVSAFLSKPTSLADLRAVINQIIQAR